MESPVDGLQGLRDCGTLSQRDAWFWSRVESCHLQRWGGQCTKDYLSAIDDAAKDLLLIKIRLGAVGASFGGYSVYYLAGNHNKRFKCFISHCGVFNLGSMYWNSEEMWLGNYDFGGPSGIKRMPCNMKNFHRTS
ncbi:MAG: prolyl oligopeptidase family serine peptidase [Saprospiraceae bacterium]|nr:prolyl oligopeptidase family serine peptidase [Candidatus Vicinibacter affinis]